MKTKVLIVEDDNDHRTLIRSMLEAEFDVYECRNTHEAYDIIFDSPPDIVLLDNRMSQGRSGYELLGILKEDKRHVPPVIFISSDLDENMKRQATRGLDAVRAVEKMDIMRNPGQLTAMINKIVDGDQK